MAEDCILHGGCVGGHGGMGGHGGLCDGVLGMMAGEWSKNDGYSDMALVLGGPGEG